MRRASIIAATDWVPTCLAAAAVLAGCTGATVAGSKALQDDVQMPLAVQHVAAPRRSTEQQLADLRAELQECSRRGESLSLQLESETRSVALLRRRMAAAQEQLRERDRRVAELAARVDELSQRLAALKSVEIELLRRRRPPMPGEELRL